MMKHRTNVSLRAEHTLNLVDDLLHSVRMMGISDREELMRQLLAFMLVDKFGVDARAPLQGLLRFCVAECLLEDPNWKKPNLVC